MLAVKFHPTQTLLFNECVKKMSVFYTLDMVKFF